MKEWEYVEHVYAYQHLLFEDGDIKNVYKESDGWIYPKNKYPNPYKETGSGEMIDHIMVCPKCISDNDWSDESHCGTIILDSFSEGKSRAIEVGACHYHYGELEESK